MKQACITDAEYIRRKLIAAKKAALSKNTAMKRQRALKTGCRSMANCNLTAGAGEGPLGIYHWELAITGQRYDILKFGAS